MKQQIKKFKEWIKEHEPMYICNICTKKITKFIVMRLYNDTVKITAKENDLDYEEYRSMLDSNEYRFIGHVLFVASLEFKKGEDLK